MSSIDSDANLDCARSSEMVELLSQHRREPVHVIGLLPTAASQAHKSKAIFTFQQRAVVRMTGASDVGLGAP